VRNKVGVRNVTAEVGLAVEAVFGAQPHKGTAKCIVRHDVGVVGSDALGQQHIVETELLPPLDFGRSNGLERPVGKQRQISRHFEELAVVWCLTQMPNLRSLRRRHHVRAWPTDGDYQIVTGSASGVVASFSTEPNSTSSRRMIRRHGDAVVRDRHDQPLGRARAVRRRPRPAAAPGRP